jgi:hypothetical protein
MSSIKNKTLIAFTFICLIIAGMDANAGMKQDKTSELAILMREMFDFTTALKTNISNKADLGKFPKEQKKMHTAVATDPSVKTGKYTAMANEYMHNLALLYKTPVAKQKVQFNLVITNCVSCHRSFCPGPIKRINTLKFADV